MGGGAPHEGSNIRSLHRQPETIEGSILILEGFGGRAHFSAYLPLLVLVKNVSLVNPSLDPDCARGFQNLDDLSGYDGGVNLHVVGRSLPGATSGLPAGLRIFLANIRTGLPGCYSIRG